MKNLQKLGIAILFTAVVVSCSSNQGGSPSVDDFMTIKIDGTSWEATTGIDDDIFWDDSHASFQGVIGNKDDNSRIFIRLDNYSGTGTYSYPQDGMLAYFADTATIDRWVCDDSVSGVTGTVTITSDDNDVITGTFSFTGKSPVDNTIKSFTEGKFSATKQ